MTNSTLSQLMWLMIFGVLCSAPDHEPIVWQTVMRSRPAQARLMRRTPRSWPLTRRPEPRGILFYSILFYCTLLRSVLFCSVLSLVQANSCWHVWSNPLISQLFYYILQWFPILCHGFDFGAVRHFTFVLIMIIQAVILLCRRLNSCGSLSWLACRLLSDSRYRSNNKLNRVGADQWRSDWTNPSSSTHRYVGGHKPSKIMRFVDKITKSKYFQKATETEFIKKKMEEVSNTPLLLTVEVQEIRGTLAVNIPPPPTDRIWYGPG